MSRGAMIRDMSIRECEFVTPRQDEATMLTRCYARYYTMSASCPLIYARARYADIFAPAPPGCCDDASAFCCRYKKYVQLTIIDLISSDTTVGGHLLPRRHTVMKMNRIMRRLITRIRMVIMGQNRRRLIWHTNNGQPVSHSSGERRLMEHIINGSRGEWHGSHYAPSACRLMLIVAFAAERQRVVHTE